MDPNSILTKTQKGVEEVETRKHKIDSRLRPLLIMVNGKATAGELVKKLGPQADAQLDELLKLGMVQGGVAAPAASAASAAPAGQFEALRAEVATLISSTLGPDGDDIAMKVEGVKTVEELKTFIESRRGLLDMALGKARAPAFWDKVGKLLA